ncbi:hypothetical protein G6F59_017075 [Rhizopus arrhizus]|nr:hypothetical protein G6F59_017075 [Rhizopus arrhizus]
MKSVPAATSAALLANSTRLPGRAAASAAGRPAAPTMAAMTESHCGSAAVSASAWAPTRISGIAWDPAQAATNRLRAASSGTTTTAARLASACSARRSMRLYADSA